MGSGEAHLGSFPLFFSKRSSQVTVEQVFRATPCYEDVLQGYPCPGENTFHLTREIAAFVACKGLRKICTICTRIPVGLLGEQKLILSHQQQPWPTSAPVTTTTNIPFSTTTHHLYLYRHHHLHFHHTAYNHYHQDTTS